MKITGTFLDEISHDIPSANWGAEEWAKDFDCMRMIGIDTVIIIRAGYKNMAIFDSATLKKHRGMIISPNYDLAEIFLREADRCGMKLFFGTYDSGENWHAEQFQKEIEINYKFTEELFSKYGHFKSLGGWYICHEIDSCNENVMRVYKQLARHLKAMKNIPILISPYIHGRKQFGNDAISIANHKAQWDKAFSKFEGGVDIVAFQDGQVDYEELNDFLHVNNELAKKYGLTCWSNVETFDRDMPINFLPIGWPKLLHKINAASQAGVDKLITFEFSHFLSPNSMYPSARGLFKRYVEWIENKGDKC
ncbi:MAG: Tat pathway signal protein [Planctomycetes bacterium GWF2_50_10]|nr:MAG: Tat pathway signal protein [Planctomycetes bacterium GWF2_50_10]